MCIHPIVVGTYKFISKKVIFYSNWAINICCCCGACLSSCHRTASDAKYWMICTLFYFVHNDYFVLGGIRTCLGVFCDFMFLWISLNSCILNLLLVRSRQAETIIETRLIKERNYVTRVRVEPISCNQARSQKFAMRGGYFGGLGAEPPAAGGQWGLGRSPQPPEAGGLGQGPQPPEARGSGGGAPSARIFCIFFAKITSF